MASHRLLCDFHIMWIFNMQVSRVLYSLYVMCTICVMRIGKLKKQTFVLSSMQNAKWISAIYRKSEKVEKRMYCRFFRKMSTEPIVRQPFCEMLKTKVFAVFFSSLLLHVVLFWLLSSFLEQLKKIRKANFLAIQPFGDNDMLQNGPKCYRLNVRAVNAHHTYVRWLKPLVYSMCYRLCACYQIIAISASQRYENAIE